MITIIACFGFGLAAFRPGFSRSAASARTPGPSVVATVEGKQISAKIYRMYLRNGIEALGLDEKTAEGRRRIEQLKEGIVSELIDRVLIEAEVSRRALRVSDEELAESYQKTVAEIGGERGYQSYLSEHVLTDEEFRQTTDQEVYGQLLRAELGKEVSVAESEIQEYYNKERNNPRLADLFKQPERVRASHILIEARRPQIVREIQSKGGLTNAEVERRVTAEMAKRRSRAASILNRLKRGADFQRLAGEYSDDPGTKNRGGDLGMFTRNSHPARFDEAAFALKPGCLSDIVETEYGHHIIRVTEHTPERTLRLDEAGPAIQQRLLATKRVAHLKAWLEDRRREADVRIDPFYRTGELEALGRTPDGSDLR